MLVHTGSLQNVALTQKRQGFFCRKRGKCFEVSLLLEFPLNRDKMALIKDKLNKRESKRETDIRPDGGEVE